MSLWSHRKETSSIGCLGNLRRLTSGYWLDVKVQVLLISLWECKQATWFTRVSSLNRDVKFNYWLFGLTLCSFSLFSVVIFSLACGWGTILGWGFCIVEYSPVCRERCSLDRIIGMSWILENGGFLVFWNPGFSSMTLECWGLYWKLIFPLTSLFIFLRFFALHRICSRRCSLGILYDSEDDQFISG